MVLTGSKPPRIFLRARRSIAVTCPDPDVVREGRVTEAG